MQKAKLVDGSAAVNVHIDGKWSERKNSGLFLRVKRKICTGTEGSCALGKGIEKEGRICRNKRALFAFLEACGLSKNSKDC